ncbi:hypothetical protein Nepgr_008608 [Nepenthes gracilis]|uniref:Rotamase n=1 Tax=Nepenthes gracilis TaxID=150966 RepID=A0AAD3S905_NEPGR|nr:hypothetical protein Nepgr_008608 [Nepenthes gracilis]
MDGGICKKILKETKGYDCPKDGTIVKVKLDGKLQDGVVFMRKGHGDGDKLFEFKAKEEQVIGGLNRINVMDLLSDMLQAIDLKNHMAVKDEVIVDLIDQCRANQIKLMQMLTTITDEGLLALGLELNDALQCALAKYDAIASSTPLLT